MWVKKKYKCVECGCEEIIMKEANHKLPKAECHGCGKMTSKPKNV